MGQGQSGEPREVSTEQLSQELALKFASKCYTQLELYCFKEVFRSLQDEESGLRYWSEATLCRFLELPDALQCGSVMHQMVSNLAAFPFMTQAPAILTMEAMMRVVTILTERYSRVLKRGSKDRDRLLFQALAVFDRRASDAFEGLHVERNPSEPNEIPLIENPKGFDIDQPLNDDPDEEDDDDLAMAALDSLDAIDAIGFGERRQVLQSYAPTDNFLHLVELLLLIAPLSPQEKLKSYWGLLSDDQNLKGIREISHAIVASFGIEDRPGILYKSFKVVIPNSLPHLFAPLSPLFEHFLFQKDFDLSKRKRTSTGAATDPQSPTSPTTTTSPTSPTSVETTHHSGPPTLLEKPGEILNRFTLTQVSFFLSPSTLFHHLHPLYAGHTHGFSLGSFEQQVFTWHAPTLLLVSGTFLPADPTDSRERSFADTLPPRRLPSSASPGTRVIYGAYIPLPWKQTNRTCFGNDSTLLFQLHPVHDVFRASAVSQNYISYVTPTHSAVHPGINFGTPLPAKATGSSEAIPLGPVSLYLDSSLEFGVFTHNADGGGSFHPSVSPARSRTAGGSAGVRRRSSSILSPGAGPSKGDWQDRFEIESVEVWGFGGEKEAENKKQRQEFEDREARRRRDGITKTGDHEQDKEILKMAGLYGYGESGGSMG